MSGKMYRFRVNPSENEPRFIEAFLQSEQARLAIDKMKTGSSDSGLNLTHERFLGLPVPIAPLDEQKRIVAEIEKQFTRLEAGLAGLRRMQANLKRYRAAVLKAACEGKLTRRTRAWPVRKLGDLASKIGSGSTPRGGDKIYQSSGTPLIRSMNVHSNGFKFEGLAYIDSHEAKKLDHVVIEANDVLLNITGASIGRVTTAPLSLRGARVNQHVCIIRPRDELLPKFLSLFLASPTEQARIMNVQVGATRQALTKAMVINWSVPVPDLSEQARIVEEVERRLSVVDELDAVVSTNLQRAIRLRQSILQRAFAGELIQ